MQPPSRGDPSEKALSDGFTGLCEVGLKPTEVAARARRLEKVVLRDRSNLKRVIFLGTEEVGLLPNTCRMFLWLDRCILYTLYDYYVAVSSASKRPQSSAQFFAAA